MTTYSVQFARDETEPLDPTRWILASAESPKDAVEVALRSMGGLAVSWLQGGDFWAHVVTEAALALGCPMLVHGFKLHPEPKGTS